MKFKKPDLTNPVLCLNCFFKGAGSHLAESFFNAINSQKNNPQQSCYILGHQSESVPWFEYLLSKYQHFKILRLRHSVFVWLFWMQQTRTGISQVKKDINMKKNKTLCSKLPRVIRWCRKSTRSVSKESLKVLVQPNLCFKREQVAAFRDKIK